MKLTFLVLLLLSNALSYVTVNTNNITSNFNTTNFMHINNGCLMDSNLNFSCIYVTQLIWLDPFMKSDIKYVCDKSKQKNLTNDQLAKLINTRFNNTLLSNCTVNTINGYGSVQLIDQCPYLYNQTC